MKKAILYCRVSSDEQAKGGSLKYQADALKRFCESNGIEVVENPDVDSFRQAVQPVYEAYPQFADYIARIQAELGA